MKDPGLSDQELALRLIRAGMREKPAPGTLQRTLSGLGLGASALGAASSAGAVGATKSATSLGAFVLTKWAAGGAVAGLVLATATYGVQRSTEPTVSTTSNALLSTTPPPARAVPGLSLPTSREPSVVDGPPQTLPAPARPAPAPGPTSVEAASQTPLAAEIAFVDRGREAFQRGNTRGALALLDGYEREFPQARLMPEVLYLRMQALRERGETGRAMELATRLLRSFPNNPHASSARAILQAAPE
jgi:hypothetical protein